jgi:hypothetical protein
MAVKSAIALAVVLCATCGSVAGDAGVPTVDLKNFCKNTANITSSAGNSQTDLDVCVEDQKMAREQIVKNWKTYPQKVRSLCVKPNEYQSAYIEWLTCMEMTNAVLKMRQEAAKKPEKNPAVPTLRSPVGSRQCPIIKTSVDGSILSVNAC